MEIAGGERFSLVSKYCSEVWLREKLDVRGHHYNASVVWKCILFVKDDFDMNVSFKVGQGDWIFVWVEDKPLAACFPELLSCARDQNAKMANYMGRNGDQVS